MTKHRNLTFFEDFGEKIVHTPMAEPFCPGLRQILIEASRRLNIPYHETGTVITIEGPRFSTKAESKMFRMWGGDVINMSTAPEAILANELGIPYVAIAMSTDYDCWKEDEEPVSWDGILEIFNKNVEKVTDLILKSITNLNYVVEEFNLKSTIRTVPDWPKPGIMFRDITTLLANPRAFDYCIKKFKEKYFDKNITKIAGIESRGFIFGAALARELNLPLVLIRKKGKLPAETIGQIYELEYGVDEIEIHKDALVEGDNVLVVDDLLATGGTMKAACDLVKKLKANIAGTTCVINLPELKGEEKLKEYDNYYLVEFAGE